MDLNIGPDDSPPPSPQPRSLACLGDSGDVATWSNIPYFLFQASARIGFLTNTLNLMEPNYRRHRTIWNALAPFRLEMPGGYQLSRPAVEQMWRQMRGELKRGEVLSHFQVFPPLGRASAAGLKHSFYCDATLTQLFEAGEKTGVGRSTRADALRRETDLYRFCHRYVAMAKATARSAVEDYGVDPAKVFVVRPGANLDEPSVQDFLRRRAPSWRERGEGFSTDRPARLGFIGKDYLRKGLPRLVDAADILHSRGRPVRVTVIGHCPEAYQKHPRVDWLGFLRKDRDLEKFLTGIDSFALGCLPSYAEPLGISTLEALRLGVPVMGTDVGGIPDCVPAGGGFLVPKEVVASDLADAIERHVFDEAKYQNMCRGAEAEADQVTWDVTAQKLADVWAGRAISFKATSR